jgi:hypothetical protein
LTVVEQKQNIATRRRLRMFALLGSLAFTSAALVGVLALASTVQQSRSRVIDALRGRPLSSQAGFARRPFARA